MADEHASRTVFSLLEVANSIRKTLQDRYGSPFWVKAEMNKLNYYQHSGHCYPDLVEKQDGKVIAQLRATLWKADYQRINQQFLRVLHEPLKEGIKVLLQAKISFDPMHGLSLHILDIDAGYTLGDLEREKQETIQRLRREGLFDQNKQRRLSILPQRLAILSVESSKGYADFMHVLGDNAYGYAFFYMLFPSILQGDKAVGEMMVQLKRIERVAHHFDAVAIIRGGGGDVGLSCYNHIDLARMIANFPIPVLTGIGHSTNETVAEMIAYQNAITPTKLAEFLLQQFHTVAVPVQDAQRIVAGQARKRMQDAHAALKTESRLFRSHALSVLQADQQALRHLRSSVLQQSRFVLRREKDYMLHIPQQVKRGALQIVQGERQWTGQAAMQLRSNLGAYVTLGRRDLQHIEKQVDNMSPQQVLKRGYSITLFGGKALTHPGELKEGDTIQTLLANGELSSTVDHNIKRTDYEG